MVPSIDEVLVVGEGDDIGEIEEFIRDMVSWEKTLLPLDGIVVVVVGSLRYRGLKSIKSLSLQSVVLQHFIR